MTIDYICIKQGFDLKISKTTNDMCDDVLCLEVQLQFNSSIDLGFMLVIYDFLLMFFFKNL
jgi:hypothetical protein